jgi:hypothetical protein|tara:strand:+ start:379 stop:1269 length:891 start_codon:yes stop_codon:yes gene_type:complete
MIRQIIAQDKNLVTYRPSLRSIGGSIAGTVLLQQIIYWDDKKGGKFYKFSEPPKKPSETPMYSDGDSWKEELGMSAKELRTALNQFAFKCGSKNKTKHGDEYDQKRKEAVVQYYTDSQRVTWYMLNRDVLSKLLLGIYKESDEGAVTNTETTAETNTKNTTPVPVAGNEESSDKSQNPQEEKAPSPGSAPPPPCEAITIAKRLAEHVQSLDRKSKNLLPQNYDKTIDLWARDIDKINRLDQREWGDIADILSWVISDSFWRVQVLSGGKLRSQFSTLVIKSAKPVIEIGKPSPVLL